MAPKRRLMKLRDIYNEIIEGKQVGTLYHYTSLSVANSILEDGFIEGGTSSIRGYHDSIRGDNKFSLSFTRNKNFHKQSRIIGAELECRFVVDGDSLSNRYKIQPITNVDASFMSFKKQSADFEYEEVILSPNPIRVPIIPYVNRVDFLIEPTTTKRGSGRFIPYDLYKFINMLKNLKKQGISINMVDKNGNPIPKELKLTFIQRLIKPLYKLSRSITDPEDDWDREISDEELKALGLDDLNDFPL